MKPTDVRKRKFRFMPWNHARTTYQYWLCHHIHTVDKSKLSACLYTDSSLVLFSSNDAAISALNREHIVFLKRISR